MESQSQATFRECLKIMHNPTDRVIINQLAKYISVSDTLIINTSRPTLTKDTIVKTLYVDVDTLSWTELDNIITFFPNLQNVIVRVHNLLGGTSRILNIIDNTDLSIFMVLVNGAYCSSIVNSSIFLRDWNSHIKADSLHVYYQMSAYNQSVRNLIRSGELNKLIVLFCHDTQVSRSKSTDRECELAEPEPVDGVWTSDLRPASV
jgi:hypothetical protein